MSKLARYHIRSILLAAGTCALLAACASSPAPRVVSVAPAPATTPLVSADVVSSPPDPNADRGGLAGRINAFLNLSRFAHAEWGIDVVDADSGEVLYSHQAQKLFVPASNAKLYTATLVLDRLGADARFNTTLYASSRPRANGILAGDLILYGRGDPSLGDAAVAPDAVHWADQFAAALAARGVTRVTGDVIGDDTWFHGPAFSSSWEVGDLQTSYAPRVSALTTNGNLMTVQVNQAYQRCCTVSIEPASAAIAVNLTHAGVGTDGDSLGIYRPPGSATVYVTGSLPAALPGRRFSLAAPDPALMGAHLLRNALARRGIRVDGQVLARHWPLSSARTGGDVVIAQIGSPPLRDLVQHMLKRSDNLYAQLLLLQTGVVTARSGRCPDREQSPNGSESWALCAMRSLLARIGIGPDQASLAEGSGLSRHDLVAPAATTSLLMWVRRQPFADVLIAGLPVAAEDGTLAYRMTHGPASHNLRAKTGTLSHAYALSGYVENAAGRELVFSLYLNRYLRPRDGLGRSAPPSPRDDLDTIASMIAASGKRTALP